MPALSLRALDVKEEGPAWSPMTGGPRLVLGRGQQSKRKASWRSGCRHGSLLVESAEMVQGGIWRSVSMAGRVEEVRRDPAEATMVRAGTVLGHVGISKWQAEL